MVAVGWEGDWEEAREGVKVGVGKVAMGGGWGGATGGAKAVMAREAWEVKVTAAAAWEAWEATGTAVRARGAGEVEKGGKARGEVMERGDKGTAGGDPAGWGWEGGRAGKAEAEVRA